MTVEIRLLEYFAATARAGSIGAAARELHLAQPTLSHQIRRLESLIGLTLFQRHHAGVSLTEDGIAVLAAAHDVLATQRRLEGVIAERRHETDDAIALGLVENVPAVPLTALLAEIRSRLPGVRIRTTVQSTPSNINAVRTALLDAAVVRGPIELDRTLRATTIAADPVGVLLSADDPLAAHDAVRATALSAEHLITFPREWAPDAYERHQQQLAVHGIDLETNSTSSYNISQTTSLVTAGLGVALVARNWFTDAAGLTWRPLGDVELVTTYELVTRNASRLPRIPRATHAAAAEAARGS